MIFNIILHVSKNLVNFKYLNYNTLCIHIHRHTHSHTHIHPLLLTHSFALTLSKSTWTHTHTHTHTLTHTLKLIHTHTLSQTHPHTHTLLNIESWHQKKSFLPMKKLILIPEVLILKKWPRTLNLFLLIRKPVIKFVYLYIYSYLNFFHCIY